MDFSTIKLPEEPETLEVVQKETNDICETLSKEHLLRGMLLRWLIIPSSISLVTIIIFTLGTTGALNSLSGTQTQLVQIQVNFSILESINSDLFISALTLTAIVIGVVPIVSFFYINELKDGKLEIKRILKERKKGKSKEVTKLLDAQDYLLDALGTNMKRALIKYTEIAVGVSIGLSGMLVAIYSFIGIQNSMQTINRTIFNNLIINISVTVLAILFIATEVFPIWWIGLSNEGFKVNRFKKDGQNYTIITPEV